MKINYVTQAGPDTASFRYRIGLPTRYLKLEDEVFVTKEPVKADIHVFSKAFKEEDAEMFMSCETTVFDVCDNWFGNNNKPGRTERILPMVEKANLITVPTREMAKIVYETTGKPALVIEDPLEFPRVEPRPLSDPPKILWFGHETNFYFEEVAKVKYPFTIVTACKPGKIDNLSMIPWSLPVMYQELKKADIVIIPSRVSEITRGKSHNRVTEAINAGCQVVAYPLPAYRELEESIELNTNMNEGIENIIRKPKCLNQNYVTKRFSLSTIGPQWKSAFESMSDAEINCWKAGLMSTR